MRLLVFLLLITTGLSVIGQEKRYPSIAMNDEQLVFGLFTDYWRGLPEEVESKLLNQGFSAHLIYDRPMGVSNFSFAAGIGWRQHNMHSNAYPVRDNLLGEGQTVFYLVPSRVGVVPIEYTMNKMSLGYFDLPIELRYRSRSDLKFKFTLGASASLLTTSFIKYRGNDFWSNPEEIIKIKRFRIPNVSAYVYSVHTRIGVRQWGFQVKYQLRSVFKNDLGPDIYPISFGLTYNPA